MLKKVAFALAASITATCCHAAWSVITKTDSMTDRKVKSATTTNTQGHSLTVYRRADGSAWATFALAERSVDQLSPKQAPLYRIDKDEPDDIDVVRRLLPDLYAWEPKWVNWQLWSGEGAADMKTTVGRLMTGRTVVFRYHLFTGGYRETTFQLAGAGPSIALALGIPSKVPARSERDTKYGTAVADLTNSCTQNLPTALKCIERVKACMATANKDADKLASCANQ